MRDKRNIKMIFFWMFLLPLLIVACGGDGGDEVESAQTSAESAAESLGSTEEIPFSFSGIGSVEAIGNGAVLVRWPPATPTTETYVYQVFMGQESVDFVSEPVAEIIEDTEVELRGLFPGTYRFGVRAQPLEADSPLDLNTETKKITLKNDITATGGWSGTYEGKISVLIISKTDELPIRGAFVQINTDRGETIVIQDADDGAEDGKVVVRDIVSPTITAGAKGFGYFTIVHVDAGQIVLPLTPYEPDGNTDSELLETKTVKFSAGDSLLDLSDLLPQLDGTQGLSENEPLVFGWALGGFNRAQLLREDLYDLLAPSFSIESSGFDVKLPGNVWIPDTGLTGVVHDPFSLALPKGAKSVQGLACSLDVALALSVATGVEVTDPLDTLLALSVGTLSLLPKEEIIKAFPRLVSGVVPERFGGQISLSAEDEIEIPLSFGLNQTLGEHSATVSVNITAPELNPVAGSPDRSGVQIVGMAGQIGSELFPLGFRVWPDNPVGTIKHDEDDLLVAARFLAFSFALDLSAAIVGDVNFSLVLKPMARPDQDVELPELLPLDDPATINVPNPGESFNFSNTGDLFWIRLRFAGGMLWEFVISDSETLFSMPILAEQAPERLENAESIQILEMRLASFDKKELAFDVLADALTHLRVQKVK